MRKEKIVCMIDNTEHISVQGLNSHLRKLNISPQSYYDEYFSGKKTCMFCESEAEFISPLRGYKKLCKSKKCLSKSRATGTLESVMVRYNCNPEEGNIILNNKATERGLKIKLGLDAQFKEDPSFFKKKSITCPEYWEHRGIDTSDAVNLALKKAKRLNSGMTEARRKNPNNYKDILTNQKQYWLNKGFSEVDAKSKVKERQTTFSLQKCIEKYGIEDGYMRWVARQDKWKQTLIKNNSLVCGYSKISQKLFWEIAISVYDDYSNIKFATNGGESILHIGDNCYLPDFLDKSQKKIIEFHGDIFHGNPKLFKSNDRPNPFLKITAEEIWTSDALRKTMLESKGYTIFEVWELEYKQNPLETLNNCIKFLK